MDDPDASNLVKGDFYAIGRILDRIYDVCEASGVPFDRELREIKGILSEKEGYILRKLGKL